MALALVIVARWKPVWLLSAALLIGAAQAFQLFAQAQAGLNLSVDLLQALPFLLTLVVLAARPGGADAPPSLGRLGSESERFLYGQRRRQGPFARSSKGTA